ncbi:MAG TPA: hypothetical protein ENI42_01505 [Thermoplasmatales archaeon]|nr:hypothetical protein [Thermoplasmatales archaeon]
MVTYGSKTKKILILLLLLGGILIVLSITSIFILPSYLQSLLSLAAILIFSALIIYIVIYRQFEKLEEIAEEMEKEGK